MAIVPAFQSVPFQALRADQLRHTQAVMIGKADHQSVAGAVPAKLGGAN
jgi:hypothetical protein